LQSIETHPRVFPAINSHFNDKSAGQPICTAESRPGGVRHTDVPHVIECEIEPNRDSFQYPLEGCICNRNHYCQTASYLPVASFQAATALSAASCKVSAIMIGRPLSFRILRPSSTFVPDNLTTNGTFRSIFCTA